MIIDRPKLLVLDIDDTLYLERDFVRSGFQRHDKARRLGGRAGIGADGQGHGSPHCGKGRLRESAARQHLE